MGSPSSGGNVGQHVIDRLAEYLTGSLTAADEVGIECHLLACTACRVEYDELGQMAMMVAWQQEGGLDDPDDAGSQPST
jgi:predicted anti-sigma-YlaC factor YlaD